MLPQLRFDHRSRNPTIFEAILIWFSVLFFWHFFFSYFQSEVENIDFLKYGATSASIYYIAKYLGPSKNFFNPCTNLSNIPEICLSLAACVFLGVGAWALLVYLDAIFNGPLAYQHWGLISHQAFSQLHWSTFWVIGSLITTSFLVPISEEIICRGFILNRLRERHGLIFSILASSIIFSLLHFNKSFIGSFLHGIILAVLAIRTSSLYPPIIVHGLYNAIIFSLTVFFGISIVGDEKNISALSYWSPELICGAIGLILLAAHLSLRTICSSSQSCSASEL